MARRALGLCLLATLASVAALRFPVPGFAGARKPPPAATQLRDALLAADSEPLDRVKIDGLVSDLSAMRVPFQGLGCARLAPILCIQSQSAAHPSQRRAVARVLHPRRDAAVGEIRARSAGRALDEQGGTIVQCAKRPRRKLRRDTRPRRPFHSERRLHRGGASHVQHPLEECAVASRAHRGAPPNSQVDGATRCPKDFDVQIAKGGLVLFGLPLVSSAISGPGAPRVL